MSNKNKNDKSNRIEYVVYFDKHTGKSGKFKGNKKEVKALKRGCPHYSYNKKGHLKPIFFNDGHGMCFCKRCSNTFPAKLIEGKTFEDGCNTVIGYLDQAIVGAIAIGANNKTIESLSQTKVTLHTFKKKTYPRIMKSVTATDNIKNKKKKNRNSGNTAYGSWGSGRR